MREPEESPAFVALLRGINVGGHNKVRMKEFVSALESAGLLNVRYYIQSGNIVFSTVSDESDTDLTVLIEGVLKDSFEVIVPVLVIGEDPYRQALERFPFSESEAEKTVFVFLDGESSAEWAERARPHLESLERFQSADGVVYLHCPNGISMSKAAEYLLAKPPAGIKATMRNWRTVNKIADMLSEIA